MYIQDLPSLPLFLLGILRRKPGLLVEGASLAKALVINLISMIPKGTLTLCLLVAGSLTKRSAMVEVSFPNSVDGVSMQPKPDRAGCPQPEALVECSTGSRGPGQGGSNRDRRSGDQGIGSKIIPTATARPRMTAMLNAEPRRAIPSVRRAITRCTTEPANELSATAKSAPSVPISRMPV